MGFLGFTGFVRLEEEEVGLFRFLEVLGVFEFRLGILERFGIGRDKVCFDYFFVFFGFGIYYGFFFIF